MRVMLAQINTTPGDFRGNFDAINVAICAAQDTEDRKKPQLIVFPELTIPGYLSQDLMYHKGFVEMNLAYLQKVVDRSANFMSPHHPYIIVGYIDRNHSGAGKPFRNMAAVIYKGQIIATYAKRLIPYYDVFDEARYFEPGTERCIVEMHGHRVGIAICEDAWNDKGSDNYNYEDNPVEDYRRFGVDTIISINSSPYVKGKAWNRIRMVAKSVDGNPIKHFIYCNQVGGQDELVFDGRSFVVRLRQGETTLVHVSKVSDKNTHEIYNLDHYESGLTSQLEN
jgi:predicted amidohydrolase